MKKISILIIMSLTYVFANDVAPVISMRYDSIDETVQVSDAIGLRFDLGSDRFTGFDTDGTDHRLYVGWKFGKIGFGHDGANPEYTVGATYGFIDNIEVDLDYVMGNTDNNIRLGLNINF